MGCVGGHGKPDHPDAEHGQACDRWDQVSKCLCNHVDLLCQPRKYTDGSIPIQTSYRRFSNRPWPTGDRKFIPCLIEGGRVPYGFYRKIRGRNASASTTV